MPWPWRERSCIDRLGAHNTPSTATRKFSGRRSKQRRRHADLRQHLRCADDTVMLITAFFGEQGAQKTIQ